MNRQVAALPFRFADDGSMMLYLVTSRGSGRWIIPKGNPIAGLAAHEVAEREAFEEAGLIGRAFPDCIGHFEFERGRGPSARLRSVDVYPMLVRRRAGSFDEQGQRQVLCCEPAKALSLITLRPLAAIIDGYVRQVETMRWAAAG